MLTAIVFSSCQKKAGSSYHFTMKDQTAIKQKVDKLLSQLRLNEKLSLLGGTGFATKPIPRLGIPPLKMTDGRLGVRWGKATAFPSQTSMAASWDTTLLYHIGEAIGQETRGKGRDVILAPFVNIARNAKSGRNFEEFGEDPFLSSRLGVNYIKGVQSQGVAATVVDFVGNTQEYHRMFINSVISQRALHEIYFPAFKAAVQQAHTLALMSSYNKLNGVYASENHYLLTHILREKWGYKNLVMSDWGGIHATMPTETSGQDLEMPTGIYLNADSIKPLLASGEVVTTHVNQQVRRILRVIVSLGLMKSPHHKDSTLVNSTDHQKLARKAAREGIVLLENKHHLLPLDLSNVDTVTVMGPGSKRVLRGGGSSLVTSFFTVTPWEALKKRIGNKVVLNYVPGIITDWEAPALSGDQLHTTFHEAQNGLKAEYFTNSNFKGKPVITRVDTMIYYGGKGLSLKKSIPNADSLFKNGFSIRWKGAINVPKSGTYIIDVMTNKGMRFFFNGKQVMRAKLRAGYHAAPNDYKIHLKAGKQYPIRLEYYSRDGGGHIKLAFHRSNKELIQQAVEAAKSSDLVLAFVGRNQHEETEGHDLKTLRLPNKQGKLLKAVTKANPKTIVDLTEGTIVAMGPWHKKVGALLDSWFSGEEAGNAIVDVLMGDYDPAGKLPLTFPKSWSDEPASKTYKKSDSVEVHKEGIFVGYRYFDEHHIKPQYPFGYGLSYTTFSFSNIKTTKKDGTVLVAFTVKNTGNRVGHEVAQVYVHKENSNVIRAPHELNGFSRVKLLSGQAKRVQVKIPRKAFSYYNIDQKSWVVEPGTYSILVGSSSLNLPLKASISW
jgi:beta-glucosidase